MTASTLPEIYRPMMGKPSTETPGRCAVCGRPCNPEKHHIVKRSAGRLFDARGVELKKPTVTLCGFGNTSGCHGLAHSGRLHFRWVDTDGLRHDGPRKRSAFEEEFSQCGHWEFLVSDEPMKYQEALSEKGWKRLCNTANS